MWAVPSRVPAPQPRSAASSSSSPSRRRAATSAQANSLAPKTRPLRGARRFLPSPSPSSLTASGAGMRPRLAASKGEDSAMDDGAGVEADPLLEDGVGGGSAGDEGVYWPAVLMAFVIPAVGGLLFGYDIGVTGGSLLSIKSATLSGTDWYDLGPLATGAVVSTSLGGAVLGSLLAYAVADSLGRRKEVAAAAALYIAGGGIAAAAPGLGPFLLGRLVYGTGIGLAMHAAPLYIGETAPSKVRGLLVSLKEGFIVGGILLGFLAGSAFVEEEGGWRFMLGAASVMGAGMLGAVALLPQSPRWLLLRAKLAAPDDPPASSRLRDDALAALRSLRGPHVAQDSLESEAQSISDNLEAAGSSTGGVGELFEGANRNALVIGAGLILLQQVTGQPSVLYYAPDIVKGAGFADAGDATRISVYIGLFKLVMTGVAVATVDKVGRRPLLLGGIGGIFLSLLALGWLCDPGAPGGEGGGVLSVVALMVYVGSYQVSFGPISWLMVSEVFPIKVRARALSVATLANFSSNALVTFVLPSVQSTLGRGGTFYGFGGVALLALGFVYARVPETKGRTLEDIERLMADPMGKPQD